jgi:hypothetical protein
VALWGVHLNARRFIPCERIARLSKIEIELTNGTARPISGAGDDEEEEEEPVRTKLPGPSVRDATASWLQGIAEQRFIMTCVEVKHTHDEYGQSHRDELSWLTPYQAF